MTVKILLLSHDHVCNVGEWRPHLDVFDAEVKQHENEQLHTLLIQQVLMCNRRSKDRLLIKNSIEKSETI